MKFTTTLTVEVTVVHVIDVPDDELEGFDWVSADPDKIASHIQKLDDNCGGEYLREFPNIDLEQSIGEVQTADFTWAVPVLESRDSEPTK